MNDEEKAKTWFRSSWKEVLRHAKNFQTDLNFMIVVQFKNFRIISS